MTTGCSSSFLPFSWHGWLCWLPLSVGHLVLSSQCGKVVTHKEFCVCNDCDWLTVFLGETLNMAWVTLLFFLLLCHHHCHHAAFHKIFGKGENKTANTIVVATIACVVLFPHCIVSNCGKQEDNMMIHNKIRQWQEAWHGQSMSWRWRVQAKQLDANVLALCLVDLAMSCLSFRFHCSCLCHLVGMHEFSGKVIFLFGCQPSMCVDLFVWFEFWKFCNETCDDGSPTTVPRFAVEAMATPGQMVWVQGLVWSRAFLLEMAWWLMSVGVRFKSNWTCAVFRVRAQFREGTKNCRSESSQVLQCFLQVKVVWIEILATVSEFPSFFLAQNFRWWKKQPPIWLVLCWVLLHVDSQQQHGMDVHKLSVLASGAHNCSDPTMAMFTEQKMALPMDARYPIHGSLFSDVDSPAPWRPQQAVLRVPWNRDCSFF